LFYSSFAMNMIVAQTVVAVEAVPVCAQRAVEGVAQ
jgi:hypothetical protein